MVPPSVPAAADVFAKVSKLRQAHEGARQLDGIQYNRGVCLQMLKRDDEAIGAYARRQSENAAPKFGSLHFPASAENWPAWRGPLCPGEKR